MLRGFTLLETLVTVIIVGVLASLGYVNYNSVKERNYSQEARANLKLIAAAEKVYRLEFGSYYGSTIVDDINDNLRLRLDIQNWGYAVPVATATDFRAEAARGACTYSLEEDGVEPAPGASCP